MMGRTLAIPIQSATVLCDKSETLHTSRVPRRIMQSHDNFSVHCLVSMEMVTDDFMQYIIIGSYFCT